MAENKKTSGADTTVERVRVAIVGAGIAGLAACLKLLESNIKDVRLIEASDRIGGRIFTAPFEKDHVELGAQWIHGESGPTYDLALKLDLLDLTVERSGTIYYANQDGRMLDADSIESLQNDVEIFLEKAGDFVLNKHKENWSYSVGKLFDDLLRERIMPKYKDQLEPTTLKAAYDSALDSERFESSCKNLNDLSAYPWALYEDPEGEKYVKLKNDGQKYKGHANLIEYFKNKIPKDKIGLNQVVETIDWTNISPESQNQSDRSIKLTYYDHDKKKRMILACEHLICTIPIGCLKQTHRSLFTPPLPQVKVNALRKLGYGCVDKLYVMFDRDFESNLQGLQILWRPDLEFELFASEKWNLNNDQFYKAFNNFKKLSNNMLLCFLVGEDAEYIETLDDQCVLDCVAELLRRCFPSRRVPRPVKIIRSRWKQNAYSRGSYTFIKTNTTVDELDTMSEPIENRVYFAGEGIAWKHIGTAHGAYITGESAADRVIEQIGPSSKVKAAAQTFKNKTGGSVSVKTSKKS